jgi:hypothetical protein
MIDERISFIFSFSLRTELLAKHAKHISDLKLYYEHEIDELKNQVNSSKMGYVTFDILEKKNLLVLVIQVVLLVIH